MGEIEGKRKVDRDSNYDSLGITLCHWLHGMEVTKYAANIDFVNV